MSGSGFFSSSTGGPAYTASKRSSAATAAAASDEKPGNKADAGAAVLGEEREGSRGTVPGDRPDGLYRKPEEVDGGHDPVDVAGELAPEGWAGLDRRQDELDEPEAEEGTRLPPGEDHVHQ